MKNGRRRAWSQSPFPVLLGYSNKINLVNKLSVLSSIRGKIRTVLIACPNPAQLPVYAPLVRAFGPETHLLFFLPHHFPSSTPERFHQLLGLTSSELRRWRMPPTPLHAATELTYTKWTQDPFCTLADQNGAAKALLAPENSPKTNPLVEQLGLALDLPLRYSPIQFQGGNLLHFDEILWAGGDLVGMQAGMGEWMGEMKKGWGVEKVVVLEEGEAGEKQALFHIDLYLTPGPQHPRTGQKRVLVGQLSSENIVFEEKGPIPPDLVKLHSQLDHAADFLASLHYEVHRLPLAIWLPASPHRLPQLFSYNNAQVQAFPGADKAIVPAYADASNPRIPARLQAAFLESDRQAQARFLAAGFAEVVPVSGPLMYESAQQKGSLHCLSKVLDREYPG